MRSVLVTDRARAQGSPVSCWLPTKSGRIEFRCIVLLFRAVISLQAASHPALRRRSCRFQLLAGFASPTGHDFHVLGSWFFVRTGSTTFLSSEPRQRLPQRAKDVE